MIINMEQWVHLLPRGCISCREASSVFSFSIFLCMYYIYNLFEG